MSVETVIGIITGGAGAVTVLVVIMTLILSDKLHTDGEFRRIVAALDQEKEAHSITRNALAEASARADAAVRASELIASAFQKGGG